MSSLLASHPDIACWRELLFAGEGHARDDYFTRSRIDRLDEFLDRFFAHDWRSLSLFPHVEVPKPQAVGFKLKYQQVDRYPGVIEYLLTHKNNIRVIHLIRKNCLATLVSTRALPAVFSSFGDANALVGTSIDGFRPKVWLNPETIVSDLDVVRTQITTAKQVIANLHAIDVSYEDLVRESSLTNGRLLCFLGIRESPLSSSYQKLLPQSPLAAIVNPEEVSRALKGTDFEPCLTSGYIDA